MPGNFISWTLGQIREEFFVFCLVFTVEPLALGLGGGNIRLP